MAERGVPTNFFWIFCYYKIDRKTPTGVIGLIEVEIEVELRLSLSIVKFLLRFVGIKLHPEKSEPYPNII